MWFTQKNGFGSMAGAAKRLRSNAPKSNQQEVFGISRMMNTREDELEEQSQSPSNVSASNYNSKLRRKFEESSTGSPSRL